MGAALDKTREVRKETGKERMPQVVYTTEEWRHFEGYQASRDLPVKDDRSAARIQSAQVIAGAELTKGCPRQGRSVPGFPSLLEIRCRGLGPRPVVEGSRTGEKDEVRGEAQASGSGGGQGPWSG